MPSTSGKHHRKADKGKKFSTGALAKAIGAKRKVPPAPVPEPPDPEEQAMFKGGYSRNGGAVGSG